MSEWVLDEAGTISVELILDRFQNFGAFSNGALDYAIDVGDIQIQAHRACAYTGRTGMTLAEVGIFVSQHDVRVADLQFSVADLAAGLVHAKHFGGAEDLLVIVNGLGSAFDDQVR